MIIGIVVAILAIIAVLLLLLLLRRRKQRTLRLSETGVMIETPGPMVRSSLSLTAQNHSQVDPFVTPSSTDTSLPSLAQRQQSITNEMRLVRKWMEDLRHKGDISTSSSDSLVPESSALSQCQTYLKRSCVANSYSSSGSFNYDDSSFFNLFANYKVVAAASASSIASSVPANAGNTL